MSSVLAATAARTALHRRCFVHLHSFLTTHTSCRYSHVCHRESLVLVADPIRCKVKNIHPLFFCFFLCERRTIPELNHNPEMSIVSFCITFLPLRNMEHASYYTISNIVMRRPISIYGSNENLSKFQSTDDRVTNKSIFSCPVKRYKNGIR